MYSIRACVYLELIWKSEAGDVRISMDKELGGLGVYVRDLVQTPFGFLSETMHLAAAIAGDSSILPQVRWLGKEEHTSLAVHGKKVELKQLRKLCSKLLKDVENELRKEVKMGISGMQGYDWDKFSAEDDLSDPMDDYSFIKGVGDPRFKKKLPPLLDHFLENGIMNSYFTKGINGRRILWRWDKCLKWLKRCRALLERIAVLCHLLGGQPARGMEMAMLRWRNSVNEKRGVYWVNECMMLLARYSKTRSITGKNWPIPR